MCDSMLPRMRTLLQLWWKNIGSQSVATTRSRWRLVLLMLECWACDSAFPPTGLEEDRARPGGNDEERQEHEEER